MSLLRSLGDLETACLSRRLRDVSIKSPVFIAGLARSGTTILLEELAKLASFGSHRYRDFPFVMTPYFWNQFLDQIAAAQSSENSLQRPYERPHKDRIRITPESPEAYEEPIWRHFFPQAHAAGASQRLTAAQRNRDFDAFFSDHIRKLLLVRQARRYLSKGNYNIARIEYLARLFPDARFIIPIRHPITHVRSLVGQHALFSDLARQDPRMACYLAAAGHYEFGPQRVPICLSQDAGERTRSAWSRGDDASGYAIQWAEIYGFVGRLQTTAGPLSNRILVVRYEDFCLQPLEAMRRILQFVDLDPDYLKPEQFGHIAASTLGSSGLSDEIRDTVGREAKSIASRFGYSIPSWSM